VKALLRLVELSLVEFSPHQGFKMDYSLLTWKSLMILVLTVVRIHDKIYVIPDPCIFYIKKGYIFLHPSIRKAGENLKKNLENFLSESSGLFRYLYNQATPIQCYDKERLLYLNLSHFHTDIYLVFFDQGSKNNSEYLEKISEIASLRCAFELFDANFFSNKKVTLSNLQLRCFSMSLYIFEAIHVVMESFNPKLCNVSI
jgi:hypothetical protein